MRPANFHSRLRALEKRQPDTTKPKKAFLPAWLVSEIMEQGIKFDDSGRPILNSRTVMESTACE